MRSQIPALLTFVAMALLLSSCSEPIKGGPRMKIVPVHGELFINGQPAKDAFVWLHPVKPHDNPDSTRGISSSGQVDAEGKFKISTYEAGDGAPVADYKIVITWNYPLGLSSWDGPDRLNGAFADPEKTGLTISVTEGDESGQAVIIPKIELEAKIAEQAERKKGQGIGFQKRE